MDNINLETAKNMKIKIYKTQTSPSLAVCELLLGLMIDISRYISKSDMLIRNGIWEKKMGSLLHGKTLGVIGLGNIGKTLIKITKGFEFNVLAYDLKRDEEFANVNKVKYCSLEIYYLFRYCFDTR